MPSQLAPIKKFMLAALLFSSALLASSALLLAANKTFLHPHNPLETHGNIFAFMDLWGTEVTILFFVLCFIAAALIFVLARLARIPFRSSALVYAAAGGFGWMFADWLWWFASEIDDLGSYDLLTIFRLAALPALKSVRNDFNSIFDLLIALMATGLSYWSFLRMYGQEKQ